MPHKYFRNQLRILVLSFSVLALLNAQTPTQKQADAFFNHHDYAEAARAYRLLVKADSSNGMNWLRLANSMYQLQRYQDAIPAYLKANDLNIYPSYVRYNLACTYAILGESGPAFKWLNLALDAGFAGMKKLETDDDLAALRRDNRFLGLLKRADKNARPCEYDERFRQFDFWLGDWHVYNPAGTRVGTNHIEKLLKGCMLQENWTSVGGISGKSTNYFDPASNKWIQVWVSQGGDNIYYEGDFKDGGMHFLGESVNLDGSTTMSRMVIEPIGETGKVHQVIETSDDNGSTWTTSFDGTYIHPEQDENP